MKPKGPRPTAGWEAKTTILGGTVLGGIRTGLERLRTLSTLDAGGVLISTVILLLTIGTVMVFSASFFHRSVEGDPYFFLRRQLLWLPIAIVSGVLASRIDYRILARRYGWVLGVTVALLGLVFVPGVGLSLNGARRWIGVGSMQFQPSELAKLAVIIFVAGFLSNAPERARVFWSGFAPVSAGAFTVVGLILLEPDFGTAMFILLLACAVLTIAGVRKRYTLLSGLLLAPAIAGFMAWRWDQVRPRLLALIEPERIYQVKQSLIGLGAGGLWGSGLGAGTQKLKFLPEPQTDFIFSVIGEELGFLGAVSVILLYLVLLFAGTAIACRARDYFGFLVASGIVIALALQAAINLAVVTASAPTKGIPLPFITFGGSAMVMTLVEVGLLSSVYRSSEVAGRSGGAVPSPRGDVPEGAVWGLRAAGEGAG